MDANQTLLNATLSEEIVLIKRLLKQGTPTNVMGKWGDTPLHIAASHRYEAVVKLLLGSGALINAQNQQGDTPLHLAAYKGHLAIVELLVKNKAAVNSQNHHQSTPLHDAAHNGCQSVVTFLLKKGAVTDSQNQCGNIPLHIAAYNGYLTIVALLLSNESIVDTHNQSHNTPLHEAAYKGHQAILALLLASGSQINSRNQLQATPLHLAASMNHQAAVKCLLDHGALTNPRNKQGNTPLHEAARENYREVMQLLLKASSYSYTHKKADGLIEKYWKNPIIHSDADKTFYIVLLLAGVDAKDNPLPEALYATRNLLEAAISAWLQPLVLSKKKLRELTPSILHALPRLIHWVSLISKSDKERAGEKNKLKNEYFTDEERTEGIKHFLLMTKSEVQQAKAPLYLDEYQQWVVDQLHTKRVPLEIMILIREQLLTKVIADTLIQIYLLPPSVANYLAKISLACPTQCLAFFYQYLQQQHWLTASEAPLIYEITALSLQSQHR